MIPSKKLFFEKFKAEVLQDTEVLQDIEVSQDTEVLQDTQVLQDIEVLQDIREKAAQIVQSILELMRKNIRR